MKSAHILVIESDEALALEETRVLEEAGYSVVRGINVPDGLKKLYEERPDLIIVDSEQPIAGGEDPSLRIRQSSYLPIIVIGSNEDTVETLESGADAYMTKPLSLIELVARVRALLRRKQQSNPPRDNSGLDIENGLPNGENGQNDLTRTEFRLASCLLLNKGRLLEYPRLISEVWGGKKVSLATLHFYIRQIRRKLTNLSISGLRGVGYYAPVDSPETILYLERGDIFTG